MPTVAPVKSVWPARAIASPTSLARPFPSSTLSPLEAPETQIWYLELMPWNLAYYSPIIIPALTYRYLAASKLGAADFPGPDSGPSVHSKDSPENGMLSESRIPNYYNS